MRRDKPPIHGIGNIGGEVSMEQARDCEILEPWTGMLIAMKLKRAVHSTDYGPPFVLGTPPSKERQGLQDHRLRRQTNVTYA